MRSLPSRFGARSVGAFSVLHGEWRKMLLCSSSRSRGRSMRGASKHKQRQASEVTAVCAVSPLARWALARSGRYSPISASPA